MDFINSTFAFQFIFLHAKIVPVALILLFIFNFIHFQVRACTLLKSFHVTHNFEVPGILLENLNSIKSYKHVQLEICAIK